MNRNAIAAWERMAWGEAGLGGAVISSLLLPLSWAYGGCVRLYRGMYEIGILQRVEPDCAILSVGNATVGGSGKTPVAIALARAAKDTGWNPCVVSYGYGVDLKNAAVCASDGKGARAPWQAVGDEAAMIADLLPDVPVLAARRRTVAIAEAVRRFGCDLIILDDGFQYWRVRKDCEVLVISGRRGFGNGRVFPAGPLRELGPPLGRADVIVWSGGGDPQSIQSVRRWMDRNASSFLRGRSVASGLVNILNRSTTDVAELRGRRIFAFCGIGDPGGFESGIEDLGGKIVGRHRYSDHHPYRREDLEEVLCEAVESGADMVVTTDKDRIKLDREWLTADSGMMHALRIEFGFDRQDAMQGILDRIPGAESR